MRAFATPPRANDAATVGRKRMFADYVALSIWTTSDALFNKPMKRAEGSSLILNTLPPGRTACRNTARWSALAFRPN